MEETEFNRYVIDELRTLLTDLEYGLQPSNIALHEEVVARLRRDFNREHAER